MKVILNKDVPQLGDEGDIKNVAAGYARNYLMPNNLAMPFSKHGLVILEQKKARPALLPPPRSFDQKEFFLA